MKIIFTYWILSLVIIISPTFSQGNKDKLPLAAYKTGNLWYFSNHKGEQIFPAQELIDVMGYAEGLFRVKKNIDGKEKICYLNMKGEVAIVADYDKAKDFSDGMAVVMVYTSDAHDDVVYGYINKEGKQVLPVKYLDATDFGRNLAYVLEKEKRGYIDKTGNYMTILPNAVGSQFHEGMSSVTNQHYKSGFINKNGDLVIDYKYDETGYFSEGLAVVGMNGKYGYINKKGDVVIEPVFDYAMPFIEDRAAVGKLDNSFRIHWGFIDKTGTATVKDLYDKAMDFSEGLASVKKDKKWGFIDKNGVYVLESKYNTSSSFVNGLAWASVKDSKEFGFIDKNGNFVIKINEPEIVIDFRLNKYVYLSD
jgi:hypothetical protein